MLIVVTNSTLDITFSAGGLIAKKIASGAYTLGSYLFEKHPFPLVEHKYKDEDVKIMAKQFGTIEAHEKSINESKNDKNNDNKNDKNNKSNDNNYDKSLDNYLDNKMTTSI